MPGYTKFCWFRCEWYSTDRKHHYNQKQWHKWESLNPGQKNVVHTPLINPEIVYLPPLHIQLGLIKNVVKTMDQNSAGFMYLKNKFPRIRDAKIKEGIFVWPQITRVNIGHKIWRPAIWSGKSTMEIIKKVTTNFFGKSYSRQLSWYSSWSCTISISI